MYFYSGKLRTLSFHSPRWSKTILLIDYLAALMASSPPVLGCSCIVWSLLLFDPLRLYLSFHITSQTLLCTSHNLYWLHNIFLRLLFFLNIQIFSTFPFTSMDSSGWGFSADTCNVGPGSGGTCKQTDTCTCQVTWPAVSQSRPLTSAAMNLTQNLVILFLSVLVTLVPHIPGQHGGRQHSVQKPTRFYIGGVLSSTAMARAFTMEAQVIMNIFFYYQELWKFSPFKLWLEILWHWFYSSEHEKFWHTHSSNCSDSDREICRM